MTALPLILRKFFIVFIITFPAVSLGEVILPSDKLVNITQKIDRNLPLPQDVFLWHEESGGHDTANPYSYNRNNWHCYSSTMSINGACPTETMQKPAANTVITLDFTEVRSSQVVQLHLYGYNRPYETGKGNLYGINGWNIWGSSNNVSYGRKLTVWLPKAEHQKLPYGGIWQATLKLRQRDYGGTGATYNASWTANITLNVTDKDNIAVYFPQFRTVTPRVNLDLQTRPAPASPGQTVEGKVALDMCLYDGYNSNSQWYDITLTDELTIAGRDKRSFSVIKENSSDTATRNRVDYQVRMQYNGSDVGLNNNETYRMQGVDQKQIRPVVLPNIPQAVLCTPTPLTLLTPAFNQIDKSSGAYQGKLKVIFTPSAESL